MALGNDAATLAAQATISTMIGIYYDKVFLERLEMNLVYDKYGEQRPLPENSGGTVLWHQLLNPTVGYTLGDGSIPAASAVSTRRVSAIPVQYADLKSISDQVDRTAVNPVVDETVKALGYGAALTKDTLIAQQIGFQGDASTGVANAASATFPSVNSQGFPVIEGNTGNVYWPTGTNGITIGLQNGFFSTIAAISHVRKAVTHLKNLAAVTFDDGNYRGIIDPTVSDHIRSDSTFPTWMAYTNRASALDKGRLGVIERVMFEETPNAFTATVRASTWSTTYASLGGTLYGTLIFGRQAYGVTKLGGKDAKVNLVTGADKSDPLNQVTYVGYKLYMAAKVLNPSAGVILTWFQGN
jgi:N4-gp56 family major capsid protein